MSTIHEKAANGSLNTITLNDYRSAAGANFDINALDTRDRTALGYAAWKGRFTAVKALIDGGASVRAAGRSNRTALWYAAAGSMPPEVRLEIIGLLMQKNPEIDEPSLPDQYTPLMKVITEHRDIESIKFLVAKGARVNIPNMEGRTAKDLAERTKDPRVIDALRPRSERLQSRAEWINLIVSIVTFILAAVNSPLITDIVQGVAKQVYKISGQDSSEIRERAGIAGPQTAEQFKKSIGDFIKEKGLDEFFKFGNDFLQSVAEKAVKLKNDPSATLRSDENIRNLTRLALYKTVIYCDDSRSMGTHDRIHNQRELVRRIARIATRIVPDGEGVGLQFINSDRDLDCNLTADEVEDIVSGVQPDGGTEIGTNLRNKIVVPLINNVLSRTPAALERPLFISIITDGHPEGGTETMDTLKDVIIECRKKLEYHGYKPTAVRFQISQIGTAPGAKDFIDKLRKDPKLEEMLYCTVEQLDKEYKRLRENDEDLEEWLLKTLISPIMRGSDA